MVQAAGRCPSGGVVADQRSILRRLGPRQRNPLSDSTLEDRGGDHRMRGDRRALPVPGIGLRGHGQRCAADCGSAPAGTPAVPHPGAPREGAPVAPAKRSVW
ncbi:hypothetical protein SSP531S_22540 [Streptomyces spongiicola]|uniref:Uncharacterized protein n=1 Tax=Streptomyces spongiicola TaxID=1690221 RepID=A0A388SY85_9ACTN|nr:hypothetical protein SSP531S_22540 [Streptomyces spongiicola]